MNFLSRLVDSCIEREVLLFWRILFNYFFKLFKI